jgi:hypothetical protein
VDSYAAKYVASQSVQASRQELISDLKRMCIVCMSSFIVHSNLCRPQQTLTKYMSYREAVEKVPLSLKAPKCLIFYRGPCCPAQIICCPQPASVDGVSEGQFQQVLDLGNLHLSFSTPKLTFAHRIATDQRFLPFSIDLNNADRPSSRL